MKSASAFVSGILVFVVVIVLLDVLRLEATYLVWLPYIFSASAAVTVVAFWPKPSLFGRTATVMFTAALVGFVLAADIAGAVWYSCSQGICL